MLLEVKGLDAGYGAVPVLRGIAMQVAQGEVIAVLGANGAGKSTLNRVLSGLMPPWSGLVVHGVLLLACYAVDRRLYPAEGVARWWLGGQGGASTLPEVEAALRQLVARRALREERLADGTTLYSKNGRPVSSS